MRKLPDGTVYEVDSTYNYQDNVIWRKDPIGRQTTYTYDTNGIDLPEVRNTTGGPDDLLASFANYTAGHLPQTGVDSAGQITRATYNSAGQILTSTNAKQERTTYEYDLNGYLRTVTGPVEGAAVSYTYDGYGRRRSVTPAGEAAVTADYDTLDRPTRTTYADGTYEETTYEKLDVATERDRAGRITRLTHDAERHLVALRDPAGRFVQQRWCGCGALDLMIDANGNRTKWERNAAGRIEREVRSDGVVRYAYTYDMLGRLSTVTDAKQQVNTYSYNLDGTVASMAYENAHVATPGATWTYDPVYPRVVTMVDGTGTTSYTYHPVGQRGGGRLATIDGPLSNDVVAYAYDELSRVVSRTVGGVSLTITYDPLGRIAQEVNPLGTFTYTFDGVSGRSASVAYPNGLTTTYTYFDALHEHELQTIHHQYSSGATLSKFDYSYDAVGNVLTWRQQADTTSVMWEYTYDKADQLVRAVKRDTNPEATVLQRFAYGFDPAGNRLYEQVDDAVTSWSYDQLNHLVAQQTGGAIRVAGTVNEPATVRIGGNAAQVDASGEFAGRVPVAVGTTRFTVTAVDPSGNVTNQSYDVDQSGTPKSFTFDANGNLASDGARTFEWDAADRLVSITSGTVRDEFTYDGENRRSRKTRIVSGVVVEQRQMLWCDLRVCEERDARTGDTLRREFTDGYTDGTGSFFYLRDQLGSVTEVVDSTSGLRSRYRYDPFGRQTAIGEYNGIGWTGFGMVQDTSILLAPWRAYDSDLGRWLSEDPAGMMDGPNQYAYVGSNPVRYIDPSGLQAKPVPGGPPPAPAPRPPGRVIPFPTPEAPSPIATVAGSILGAALVILTNADPAGDGSDLNVPPGELPDVGPQRCRPYRKTRRGCTCFVACNIETIESVSDKVKIPKIFPKHANGVGTGNDCREAAIDGEREAKQHFAAWTGGREIGLKTRHCHPLWCKEH